MLKLVAFSVCLTVCRAGISSYRVRPSGAIVTGSDMVEATRQRGIFFSFRGDEAERKRVCECV